MKRLGAKIASLAGGPSRYERARLLGFARKRVPSGEEVEAAFLGRMALVSPADVTYVAVWAVLFLALRSGVGGLAAGTLAWVGGLAAALAIARLRKSPVRVVVTTSTSVRVFRSHWTGGLLLLNWPHELVASLPRDTPIVPLSTGRFDPWRHVVVDGVGLCVSRLEAAHAPDLSPLEAETELPPRTRTPVGHGSP